MSDTHSRDRDEERPKPKVDGATKLAQLQEKLAQKKQRFYTLSEQVFDINQECMSKNDEMKSLKDQCARNNEIYVDAMTELALKEADLQYRKEHSHEKSSNVTHFELESNQDVERYRSELKYALQKYQESRRNAKKLQAEFSRLSDSSRVESLNFLAFCKYSQSVQMNEINKLSVSEELPSKKEISVCTTEFTKCAERSRAELSNFYKLKVHEFQREERIQLGKTKSIMEANLRNRDGTMGNNNVDMNENVTASIDHHLHVNSLENRTAQKLIADAQAQFYADAHPPVPKTGSFSRGPSRHGSFSGSFSGSFDNDDRASKAGKLAAALSAAVATEHSAQNMVAGHNRGQGGASRGNKRAGSAAGGGPRKSAEPPSAAGVNSKPNTAPKQQKSQFRTQLSQLYRQRKRAANNHNNNTTTLYSLGPHPKMKSVFDATPFRTLATPESTLLQNTLLDTELTDAVTSTNLVLSESGKYIDQGEALGNLMSQLCAAEGKFRQLNAIKEGLDMQLVKQAHFLLLIGRDLHSDIVSKAHVGSNPIIPTIISNTGGSSNVNKVLETDLAQAFARPDESTSRSVGSLTAGGAIGNKYRYRIDPSATTAAPLVPFTEVQQDYKECEDKIRKFLYDTARVLKIK